MERKEEEEEEEEEKGKGKREKSEIWTRERNRGSFLLPPRILPRRPSISAPPKHPGQASLSPAAHPPLGRFNTPAKNGEQSIRILPCFEMLHGLN